MTQSNNKNPFDKSQAENSNHQQAHQASNGTSNDTPIHALNLRWQEIRKWELNRLRAQELNHHLAFMRKSIKQSVKIKNILQARNNPSY